MPKHVCLFLIALCLFCLASPAMAALPIGMYGVAGVGQGDAEAVAERLEAAGVDRVFVPADADTIRFFKNRGFAVYVSVNVFGGRKAWEQYPDARPIKADGTPIGEAVGEEKLSGVCPTHEKWRRERLARIEALAAAPMDDGARPDGIWLDFIRYPGYWETPDPVAPDTCFCPRCLAKFTADTGVPLPEGLSAKEASEWIYANAHLAWQKWKQDQIDGFVREAKALVDRAAGGRPVMLGVFTVPWTRSDFNGALLFRLAQDPFALSKIADVISPMVYHRMCGRAPHWVGYMTRYLKETAKSPVWPVIQSVNMEAVSFAEAASNAGRGGADGLLVFSMKGMTDELWPGLGRFGSAENLVPNPGFSVDPGSEIPERWSAVAPSPIFEDRTQYTVRPSSAFEIRTEFGGAEPPGNCLGIIAGEDRQGQVETRIYPCQKGVDYLFEGRIYSDRWENGIYPSIHLWGKAHRLDTVLQAKTFQPVRIHHRCTGRENDGTLAFSNPHRGRAFWLKSPTLVSYTPFRPETPRPAVASDFFPGDFFPIGVFGADPKRLEEISMLAVNTVVLSGPGERLREAVETCRRKGLRYVIVTPRDPADLRVFLSRIAPFVDEQSAAFYVNDEPGIWAFPRNTAEDNYSLVRRYFPQSKVAVAVIRPQVCRDFQYAADLFMLDPYPVPNAPLTRIADVMDRARKDVGAGRLASVIQAFGGDPWEPFGWWRAPTWREMDCMAFLSVVHGSRGIFFFTYREIGKTDAARQKLGRVVGRLNRVYPWLKAPNTPVNVAVDMRSPDRFDTQGRPAVHACLKERGESVLLIAVNTLGAPVSARLRPEIPVAGETTAMTRGVAFTEVFSGEPSTMTPDGLYADFGPYETKAWTLERPR